MNKKEGRKEKREGDKIRRVKEIEKLAQSDVIKNAVKETIRRNKVLSKSKRPAAIRDRQMTAEDVTADIEKEAEDVAELRKAMSLGTLEESKNV